MFTQSWVLPRDVYQMGVWMCCRQSDSTHRGCCVKQVRLTLPDCSPALLMLCKQLLLRLLLVPWGACLCCSCPALHDVDMQRYPCANPCVLS